MIEFRPFESRDILATALGFAVGLFYGFMGFAIFTLMFEGAWIILLLGLPFLLFQIFVILGFDRLFKWLRRNAPPPPIISWPRRHAFTLGAVPGILIAAVMIAIGGPLLGPTT